MRWSRLKVWTKKTVSGGNRVRCASRAPAVPLPQPFPGRCAHSPELLFLLPGLVRAVRGAVLRVPVRMNRPTATLARCGGALYLLAEYPATLVHLLPPRPNTGGSRGSENPRPTEPEPRRGTGLVSPLSLPFARLAHQHTAADGDLRGGAERFRPDPGPVAHDAEDAPG